MARVTAYLICALLLAWFVITLLSKAAAVVPSLPR